MPSSYTAGWSHTLLSAFLRSANTGITVCQLSAVSGLRIKNGAAADFASAANGEQSITGAGWGMTHSNAGTVTTGGINNGATITTTLTVGTAAPVELEFSNLSNGTVISSSSVPPATTITRFKVGFWKKRGTVEISTTLRNMLCELFTGKRTSHISANGTIKVYSGTAPSPDAAATGTLLWQKTMDTTSSFTWAAPSADACALVSSLTGNSETLGGSTVCGYARIAWTHNSVDYVIQGSVGQGTGDFQFTTLGGAGNNEMASVTSYTLSNATIAFT